MRESNKSNQTTEANIQCIEVLVSKHYLTKTDSNLFWTLSVYSLQNQPVKKNRAIQNSEVFHFMVYDWKRTVKQLLEDSQVPYSIIQFFSLNTVCADPLSEGVAVQDNEVQILTALQRLYDDGGIAPRTFSKNPEKIHETERADLFQE